MFLMCSASLIWVSTVSEGASGFGKTGILLFADPEISRCVPDLIRDLGARILTLAFVALDLGAGASEHSFRTRTAATGTDAGV